MLNIPDSVKALFKADGIRKNFRVRFPNGELPDLTNEDLVQESVKFTESLCSQDVLKFGLTESSVIEFETVGVANMYGMEIECYCEIDLSSLSAADIATIAAGTWDGELVQIPIGKNLFNYPAWAGTGVQNGTAVYENNGVTLTATAGDCYTDFGNYPVAARIPVTEGEPVTLSWESPDAVHGNQIIFPNGDIPGLVADDNYGVKKLSYTPTAGVTFVTIRFGVSSSGDVIHYKNIMVEAGSTATAFEPYTTENWFRIPYGKFRVESCPRDHQAMAHRQVQAFSLAAARKEMDFPSGMLWPEIYADPIAIISACTGAGATYYDTIQSAIGGNIDTQSLYDANGNAYALTVTENNLQMMYTENISLNTQTMESNDPCTFIQPVMPDFDLAAYDAFGVAVAEALHNVGRDLWYNSDRKKIFNNNEEALRKCYPWLFSPCIWYVGLDAAGGYNQYITMAYPVTTLGLSPVINSQDNAANSGFSIKNNKFKLRDHVVFISTVKQTAGATVSINLNNSQVTTISTDGCLTAAPSVKRFKTTSSGFKVKISNTGENKANMFLYNNNNGVRKSLKLKAYDFYNIAIMDLAQGALELNAYFAKPSRSGGFELIRLSTSSPAAVAPGEYSQFWWDEYDVLPIGTVKYAFTDADNNESINEFRFGGGSSVYDMTDNMLIKAIENPSISNINAKLRALFVPNIGPVAFTPIDLNMKGLPYLESGDYLAVTAEDGTVANSFAMRSEMTGIQVLTAAVQSSSGEILESGESI